MKRALLPLLAVLAGCPERRPPPRPPAPAPHDANAAHAPDPATEAVRGVLGPFAVRGATAAAASPVRWIGGALRSVLAFPADDGRSAELWLMGWSPQGAERLATSPASWTPPGSGVALVARDGATAAVWSSNAVDGGVAWRAVDLRADGFAGTERSASGDEVAASAWTRDAMLRRSREGVAIPAAPVTAGGVTLRIDVEHDLGVARLGEVEVVRGADLLGYQPAAGLDLGGAGERWLAVTRGECAETRVEIYSVAAGRAQHRGAVTIGKEVGVRWLSVDPAGASVAVSWYQELIPIRMRCTRGPDAPSVADQGMRVALFPR